MNCPNWLWWLIGLFVLLAVLWLLGVRFTMRTGQARSHLHERIAAGYVEHWKRT